jgi:transmembrane protein EpsG
MWVFYILLLIPVMIQHFKIRDHQIDCDKSNKRALGFFFFFLTILVMLRHESVGSDTRNYIFYFEKFSNTSWNELEKQSLEYGFSFLNKLVSIFTKEPQFFFAVVAIIVSVMIYPTYKRLCIDSSLTIVLFCTMSTFVMMFSGIRQMLAIAIGFIAYEFTRNKKLILFILAVLLAITFHTSAFILALMYPIYHAKITKKWLLVVVPALTVVFVFNRQIFSALAFFLERYTEYDASMIPTGAYTMLILFVVFTVFAFLIPEEPFLDNETIGLRNFLLLALVIQKFAPLHTIAMRMNYYYIIFIPLLIPKIIEYRSDQWRKMAVLSRHIMVAFFLIYFFINAYSGVNLRVFPYHFFWENL